MTHDVKTADKHYDIKGNVNLSRIRKVMVNGHREDSPKGKVAVSAKALASQMTHDVKTADKHYDIKGNVNLSRIRKVMCGCYSQ